MLVPWHTQPTKEPRDKGSSVPLPRPTFETKQEKGPLVPFQGNMEAVGSAACGEVQ